MRCDRNLSEAASVVLEQTASGLSLPFELTSEEQRNHNISRLYKRSCNES